MSSYNKVLAEFSRLGYTQTSQLSQTQIKKALDKICQRNAGQNEFDHELEDELWHETPVNSNGNVVLKDYIDTIVRGQNALQEHIKKCDVQLGKDITPERKAQLQQGLLQFDHDLKMLTVPFSVAAPTTSKMLQQSRNSGRVGANSGLFGRSSGIFADIPSQRQNSVSIKITFAIVFIMFLFELILMYHKHHFLNLMVYLAIFAMMTLNFFDKYYNKVILVLSGVSIIFDLFWLIAHSDNYWNPYAPTQHSTLQTTFLRFVYFFVIILMILKILLIIMLWRYRNNEPTVRKSVTLFGNTFNMDGRVTGPLSKIISGHPQSSQYQYETA